MSSFIQKKRLHYVEDNTYSYLLIVTILTTISGIILGLLVNPTFNVNYTLIIFCNKIYLVFLMLWILVLSFYAYYISIIKKGKVDKLSIVFKIIGFIHTFIIFLLPLNTIIENSIAIATGLSVIYTYFVIAIGFLMIFILLLMDRKNFKSNKYIPIYLLALVGSIDLVVQILYPNLNYLINPSLVLIVLFMYFTIENPDILIVEELYKAKESAEISNNEKSLFLFKITKKIREPLREINKLSIDALKESIIEEKNKKIEQIKDTSKDSLALMNEVLDISELENRKIPIENHKYKPLYLFKNIASMTKIRLKNKNIEFREEYDRSIPEYLYGDSLRLKQILSTLLENAVCYTETGFIEFSVSSIIKHDICRLIIEIEDSGVGMDAQKVNHLFDRVDDELDDGKKKLTFVKLLTDLIGGTITVSSELHRGTKFIVVIEQNIFIEPKSKTTELVNQYKTIYAHAPEVLLVISNETLKQKLNSILKKLKISYTFALTGQECLEKIRNKEKYQLIIIEEDLPKLSSIHTLEKLHMIEDFCDTSVVIITKYNDIASKDNFISIGFDDIITLPIMKDDVKQIIEKYVEKNRM